MDTTLAHFMYPGTMCIVLLIVFLTRRLCGVREYCSLHVGTWFLVSLVLVLRFSRSSEHRDDTTHHQTAAIS